LLRYLKSLIYNSVAELRDKNLWEEFLNFVNQKKQQFHE